MVSYFSNADRKINISLEFQIIEISNNESKGGHVMKYTNFPHILIVTLHKIYIKQKPEKENQLSEVNGVWKKSFFGMGYLKLKEKASVYLESQRT